MYVSMVKSPVRFASAASVTLQIRWFLGAQRMSTCMPESHQDLPACFACTHFSVLSNFFLKQEPTKILETYFYTFTVRLDQP